MSVDERTRHAIHGRFEELLGPELAGAFMSYLPPVGWADVATKRDLDTLRSTLTSEFRTELHQSIGSLRTELHQDVGSLRTELHQEIGSLRTELHQAIGSLRTELHQEATRVSELMDDRFRTTIFALVGTNATLAGIAFAAARFA